MSQQPGDPSPEERQETARHQGKAYQGAFEAVFAILIMAGLGLWIDSRFETTPWGLVIGTAIGFASFVLRLLRLGKQLHPPTDPN
jgi:F0F1-type ATP synthase assembly protein I